MEQNLPILTKKLWNIAKLALLMLRKGVSKKKLLINLNLMMNKQQEQSSQLKYGHTKQKPFQEYEFSCRNTPLYVHYLNKRSKNKHYLQQEGYDFCMESPIAEDIDMKSLDAIDTILETIVQSNKYGYVRELRVSDSPFSVRNVEDSDQRVDEYAEEFIKRFYSQLKEQTCELGLA